jgi:hypothetical protein
MQGMGLRHIRDIDQWASPQAGAGCLPVRSGRRRRCRVCRLGLGRWYRGHEEICRIMEQLREHPLGVRRGIDHQAKLVRQSDGP